MIMEPHPLNNQSYDPPELMVDLSNDISEIFENHKQDIYVWMKKAINYALDNNKRNVIALIMVDVNTNQEFEVNLNRRNFNNSLESMLNYYSNTEEYDKCVEIEQMIERV